MDYKKFQLFMENFDLKGYDTVKAFYRVTEQKLIDLEERFPICSEEFLDYSREVRALNRSIEQFRYVMMMGFIEEEHYYTLLTRSMILMDDLLKYL